MTYWNHGSDPAFNQLGSQEAPGWHRGVKLANWWQRAVPFTVDHWWVPLACMAGEWPRIAQVALGAVVVAWWAFNTFMTSLTGQSVGKRLYGTKAYRIRLDRQTGTMHYVAPGWTAAFREPMHLIDLAVLGLGFLWPLWDDKRQTWTDNLQHTFVAADGKDLVLGQDSIRYTTVE